MKTLKYIKELRHTSLVRVPGRKILQILNRHQPTLERNRILGEGCAMLGENISLDYSKRHGTTIFHNHDNSLIARGDSFEPEVQECLCCLLFLDQLRGNVPRFGDIGANIGLHTFFLKDKFPDLNIVAFDPSPFSWKYMELTLRYNHIQGVTLNRLALGDKEDTVDFYTWGESSAGDSLRNTERQPDVPFDIIPVRMTKLDDLTEAGVLTVIKMDCEGAEINAIKGMQKSIAKNKPLIVTEFNHDNQRAFGLDRHSVYSVIEEIEYSIYSICFRKLNREEFVSMHLHEENFVLIPNDYGLSKGTDKQFQST